MLTTFSFEHSLKYSFSSWFKSYYGSTLWKLNPHKIVGYALISSNKQVSVRECWKISVVSIPH